MSESRRIVLVTGSTRGIGRAVAEIFVAAGDQVIITGTKAETAEKVAQELGHDSVGLALDVANADSVTQSIDLAVKLTGRLDVVVNNAGITRDGLLLRMDPDDWDAVLDTNLRGAFLVTKAASRIMLKQRSGRIINISSIIGLIGNAGQANYSAAKAGLIGFTKACAKEFASRGITVNAVAPGYIDTDMTRDLPEAARTALSEKIPLGRTGSPADVASVVRFLASAEAGYITGQVVAVDGGLTM
jgi:3-oxoacyl-[acyl-carrier protein] reductase